MTRKCFLCSVLFIYHTCLCLVCIMQLLYNRPFADIFPPEASLGEPTTVTVRLLISDIFEVDEEHMVTQ